ncbi:MAG TPA: response regulator [Nitrospiraceae bacterium]|jgi:DNA-binding response OmpR family regulator|nr:response regulator [Nitrospiraceae bacterium]
MPERKNPERAQARGHETILLVEDDHAVRILIAQTLSQIGYRVLKAADGVEAMALSESYHGPIHLLVADVIMPQMSGPELVDRLTTARPNLKILYISGHPEEAIIRHGVLEAGVQFLPKPFTPENLVRKVREVLDTASPS